MKVKVKDVRKTARRKELLGFWKETLLLGKTDHSEVGGGAAAWVWGTETGIRRRSRAG